MGGAPRVLLLAALGLLGAAAPAPCRVAPAPRCPPPPTAPPLPPDCVLDEGDAGTEGHGDSAGGGAAPGGVTTEGTPGHGATTPLGDTLGHVTAVYGGDTATGGRVTGPPGGDNVGGVPGGDVLEEGTEEPCVTEDPGDTLGRVTASQGGDKVGVAPGGDVLVEGTERPSATTPLGDTSNHATEVYRGDTTMVGSVTASQGGDKVGVAPGKAVLMEGTERPSATTHLGDNLEHVTVVYREEATTTGSVTASQGGDKDVVAPGGDVLEEGTEEPCVTEDPGDTLGGDTVGAGGDVTTAARVTASQGGDNVGAARGGDVLMEGTERPSATTHPGDISNNVTEVYRGVTTMVGSVTMSQGGDKVEPGGDILVEGTGHPSATTHPGDNLDHVTTIYRGDTTMVGSVTTSQGGDKDVVAPGGDVLEEGTEEPCVTDDPGDALGGDTVGAGGDVTTAAHVTVSQGGDKVGVAPGGDILVEGTGQPSATTPLGDTSNHVTEVYRGVTTMVGRVTVSPVGDNVGVGHDRDVLMEGTGHPSATTHPGDNLEHVTVVYREEATTMGSVTVSPAGDKAVVAPGGDVLEEGTEEPCVTDDPGDTLGGDTVGHGGDVTTAARVTASQGGDKVGVAPGKAVLMEGTERPSATTHLGDNLEHVTVVYREEATTTGRATMSQGGDKVGVAPGGDILVEGTGQPSATTHLGDTSNHVTGVYRGDTTMVGRVTVSPAGDKAVVAPGGDVLEEGTEEPCVTGDPGDTLGHANAAHAESATTVGRVPASPGGDTAGVGHDRDVLVEGTPGPGATTPPGVTSGHVPATRRGDTPTGGGVTAPPAGDKATGGGLPARRPPPRCRPRGPPAPAGAFPVTAGPPRTPSPQAASGAFGLAPPPPLLLLLLLLLLTLR